MITAGELLIQVVPQLKPGRCGVTDHAVRLADELKREFGIDTAFVVLNSDERCDLPYSILYHKPEELLGSCLALRQNRPAAVLVHVSGYGYSRDGAPAGVASAIEALRADGRFRVAGYFHEVSASGPPWSSAFWYGGRQRAAIRRIARACDLLVTNIGAHARWLERETGKRPTHPIDLLPVFSTIGEARERIPVADRAPAMVIFGLPGSRRRAYKELSAMPGAYRGLDIKEVIDIGANCQAPDSVDGIPVRRKGELAGIEVAKEISHATFGFVSYPSICLGKSSIFASYCAQGTIPVIAPGFDGELDGLRDGVQVMSPRTVQQAAQSGLEQCSRKAWQWYAGHNVAVHAATYARWMNQPLPEVEREEARC
jgi:hypothetical protein